MSKYPYGRILPCHLPVEEPGNANREPLTLLGYPLLATLCRPNSEILLSETTFGDWSVYLRVEHE